MREETIQEPVSVSDGALSTLGRKPTGVHPGHSRPAVMRAACHGGQSMLSAASWQMKRPLVVKREMINFICEES
jgi:hypothetical protein